MQTFPTAPIVTKLRDPQIIGPAIAHAGDDFARRFGAALADRIERAPQIADAGFLVHFETLLGDMLRGRADASLCGYPRVMIAAMRLNTKAIIRAVCDPDVAEVFCAAVDERDAMMGVGQ